VKRSEYNEKKDSGYGRKASKHKDNGENSGSRYKNEDYAYEYTHFEREFVRSRETNRKANFEKTSSSSSKSNYQRHSNPEHHYTAYNNFSYSKSKTHFDMKANFKDDYNYRLDSKTLSNKLRKIFSFLIFLLVLIVPLIWNFYLTV
jgi:hypothetical protein